MFKLKELKEYVKNGNKVDYLMFWGNVEKGDKITKACLSQWYHAPFSIEFNPPYSTEFKNAEQFMMACKALLFKDFDACKKIIDNSDPRKCKQHGREVKNFDLKVWKENREIFVSIGNRAKFEQNEKLKEFLLSTKGKVLVEASPYDDIWGIKLSADDSRAYDPFSWKGLNLLGFILMELRYDMLREIRNL